MEVCFSKLGGLNIIIKKDNVEIPVNRDEIKIHLSDTDYLKLVNDIVKKLLIKEKK